MLSKPLNLTAMTRISRNHKIMHKRSHKGMILGIGREKYASKESRKKMHTSSHILAISLVYEKKKKTQTVNS